MKQQYFISEFHFDGLKDYIADINKRAKKLGQKEITYKVLDEQFSTVGIKEVIDGELYERQVVTKVYTVEIEAEPVGVEGYRFVALIEHSYESGNIVHAVDDVQIPAHYHTVEGICEHCHTNRRRKKTVLLMNEEGKFIQIGRSCLKDYIGYDIENELKYADLVNLFLKEMSERWEGFGGGSNYIPYIDLAKYLIFVEQEINKHGWISKSSVERVEQSTAYNAELAMQAWDAKHPNEEIAPSEFVQNAIEWIRTTDDVSRDYMANLQVMCRSEYVRVKDMGYVASLLNAYKNHLDYLRKQELKNRAKGASNHIGIVGNRMTFDLVMERYTWYDTMYGTIWIYIFRDNDGNCIIWKSSKCIECNEGQSYKIKGTIKEHSEFNGEKQTILTRCAVLEGSK